MAGLFAKVLFDAEDSTIAEYKRRVDEGLDIRCCYVEKPRE